MSISSNDLKNGMALNLPEGLVTVVEFQHVKPGKGGAFVRTKLKNYRTGAVVDKTFRADEKVPLAIIDKREMQYLYREGADYVFMDTSSYDQVHVAPSALGDAVKYLKEGDSAILPTYNDEILGVDLPAAVELVVTDPHGASRSASVPVLVGNERPVVTFLQPQVGDFFEPDQPITYRLSVPTKLQPN